MSVRSIVDGGESEECMNRCVGSGVSEGFALKWIWVFNSDTMCAL